MPLQLAVTNLVWGPIWTRSGLDLKTRTIITVSLLLALNRRNEVAIHINGALNNGVTKEELQEILLHVGCYCGWPTAVEGFEIAGKILSERENGRTSKGDQ